MCAHPAAVLRYGTNCWLLSKEGSDQAVVVDPGFSPERVHAILREAGKTPVSVLATHGHFDTVAFARADLVQPEVELAHVGVVLQLRRHRSIDRSGSTLLAAIPQHF